MRELGWEEALRAWRIFQATVFEYLYVSGNLKDANPRKSWTTIIGRKLYRTFAFWRVEKPCKKLIDLSGKPVDIPTERWFETRSHLQNGMSYHPGAYLQRMLNLIYGVAFICLLLTLHVGYRLIEDHKTTQGAFAYIITGLFTFWALTQFMHSYSRRKMLEEGLLSINSCAVLWQAASCAHYITLLKLNNEQSGALSSYKGYSKTLGAIAVGFCNSVFDPYEWYQHQDLSKIIELPSLIRPDKPDATH